MFALSRNPKSTEGTSLDCPHHHGRILPNRKRGEHKVRPYDIYEIMQGFVKHTWKTPGMDMAYDPSIHHRRSVRLRGRNYSKKGAYYVTVCTRHRECLFGNIVGDEMYLNDAGKMVRSVLTELPKRFHNIELGKFIVMPNHLHAAFFISRSGKGLGKPRIRVKGSPNGTLPGSVGRILQAFKSMTTDEYIHGVRRHGWKPFNRKLWQRNYWDHIIRNENDYNRICEYIENNPSQWQTDRLKR